MKLNTKVPDRSVSFEGMSMKIGLVLSANQPELAWNAFRLGLRPSRTSTESRCSCSGGGSKRKKCGTKKFGEMKMMREFVNNGGTILACSTCLRIRSKGGTELRPISTMQDMLDLAVESDRVLTFG